jgi:hypothetical protein
VFLLPPTGGVSYSIDDRTVLSLIGSYDSGRWNIAADGAGPERNVYVRNVRAGVKLERHLFGLAWGYLHGGYSFLRKLEIDDQDENSLVDEDIKPGPFLQVGLNARF